jgi:hypothetical protein
VLVGQNNRGKNPSIEALAPLHGRDRLCAVAAGEIEGGDLLQCGRTRSIPMTKPSRKRMRGKWASVAARVAAVERKRAAPVSMTGW